MELKLEVSAGASRKLNRQQYGGAAYESSDVWVSFKKELPADADQSLVEATARHLQKMADRELEAEVKRVVQTIAPKRPEHAGKSLEELRAINQATRASQTPPAQESHPRTPEGAKTLQKAPTASQTPSSKEPGDCQWPGCDKDGKGFKHCYQHSKALKDGAVPAKPVEPIPDTVDGQPFAS